MGDVVIRLADVDIGIIMSGCAQRPQICTAINTHKDLQNKIKKLACWCKSISLCSWSDHPFYVSWWDCRAFPLECTTEPTNMVRKLSKLYPSLHYLSAQQNTRLCIICDTLRDCQSLDAFLSIRFQ